MTMQRGNCVKTWENEDIWQNTNENYAH